jgi:hypothetical protein
MIKRTLDLKEIRENIKKESGLASNFPEVLTVSFPGLFRIPFEENQSATTSDLVHHSFYVYFARV